MMTSEEKLKQYAHILRDGKVTVFEYDPEADILYLYNECLQRMEEQKGFLQRLETEEKIHPEDRKKTVDFLTGQSRGPAEVREITPDGQVSLKLLERLEMDGGDEKNLFGSVKDVSHVAEWEDEQLRRSRRDEVTGLVPFLRFREEADRLIADGFGEFHQVVYTDIEDFKYINQKYGYPVGDRILKEFADYLSGIVENVADVLFARVISDQFIMLSPCRFLEPDRAEDDIMRINREFADRIAGIYPEIHLRLRSGIYMVEPSCDSASAAMDAANFARKQIQRNAVRTARVYDDRLRQRRLWENELLNGMYTSMEKGEFKVYLQPKFSLKDNSVVGAEALVRLQREDGTLVPPDSFIPLLENTGKIVDLDFYVFEKVAEFLAKNQRLGRRQVPISVNASILHAADEKTVQQYLDILKKHGVDPSLTEIELTETAAVTNYDNVRQLFRSLQEERMQTAMDDFGAGYSVLNTVIDIPVNTVKIDRDFVRNCEASEKGIYLLRQMVALVKGLGYHVVCEGLETDRQVEILKDAGCEEGQGFWFARPMPMEDYEKLVYPEEN